MISQGLLEKDREDLMKSKLQKLEKLLDYKNRKYCKKYLRSIVNEFFE